MPSPATACQATAGESASHHGASSARALRSRERDQQPTTPTSTPKLTTPTRGVQNSGESPAMRPAAAARNQPGLVTPSTGSSPGLKTGPSPSNQFPAYR